jgi:hypothetical protein
MGTALFAIEHANPQIFYRRVVCTNNEDHDGQCWPCQKNKQMWDANRALPEGSDKKYTGAWKAKINMYVNVLVRDEEGNETIAVLSRPKSNKSYVDDLIQDAVDEGYISNCWYRITRKGAERSDTSYRLKRLKDADLDLTQYADQITDLHSLVHEVDYASQKDALGVVDVPVSAAIPPSDDEESNGLDDW